MTTARTLAIAQARTRGELLAALCREIDPASREALRDGDPSLVIGAFNRTTLLRMLEMEGVVAADAASPVDPASVRALVEALDAFLQEQMADQPEGHRWIVLACVFLAFVVCKPLHPRDIVGWELAADGTYACPTREDVPSSLCRWCVCDEMRQ